MVGAITVHSVSVLCISWTPSFFPPFCPKMQHVSILTPLWNWMGKERVCMYLLLTHIVLNIFRKNREGKLLKYKAIIYICFIKALTV